jgi:DNA-binding CsgD family transcriptional regulator/GAF domain-containing protein
VLRSADLRGALELADELSRVGDSDALSEVLLGRVRALIPCDLISYNEIDIEAQRAWAVVDPADSWIPGSGEVLAAYAHHNPLIVAASEARGMAAMKISDFISRRQLHGRDIYDQLYKLIDVEYQLAIALPAREHLVIGVALSRRVRDFSERDRELLDLIRPSIVTAHANALARTHLRAALSASDRGVALFDAAGQIDFLSPLAERWLEDAPDLSGRLERWVAARGAGESLRIPAGATVLSATFIAGGGERADAVVLVAERGLDGPGLTRRERAVLSCVAHAMTNNQVARELGVSPRTVAKHLQHIFEKLGVGTRLAAVNAARDLSVGERPC